MLFQIVCDAVVASLISFFIINVLAYAFYHVFLRNKEERFSLNRFIGTIKSIIYEEKE